MKTISAIRISFFIASLTLTALLLFDLNAFASTDSVSAGSQQLFEINNKLDAAQKRDEKILANQEKILNEIIKSRKWAYNN